MNGWLGEQQASTNRRGEERLLPSHQHQPGEGFAPAPESRLPVLLRHHQAWLLSPQEELGQELQGVLLVPLAHYFSIIYNFHHS